jgi:hypothetical protein
MNSVDAVMLIEGGSCSEEEFIEAMQSLVDSGVVWHLQGSYGRLATDLIEAGHLTTPPPTL